MTFIEIYEIFYSVGNPWARILLSKALVNNKSYDIILPGDDMKIINEPIKVIAVFQKDGEIEPAKFWYEDQPVMVEKILKTYEDKNFGNNNMIFVCQHKGSSIYELKYEIKSNTWFLYKK